MAIKSEKITIDIERLTLGDIEFFEEFTGDRLEVLQQGSPSAKALIALVYLTKRREDPSFSLEDAKAVPITDLAQDEADPTDAASAASAAS